MRATLIREAGSASRRPTGSILSLTAERLRSTRAAARSRPPDAQSAASALISWSTTGEAASKDSEKARWIGSLVRSLYTSRPILSSWVGQSLPVSSMVIQSAPAASRMAYVSYCASGTWPRKLASMMTV